MDKPYIVYILECRDGTYYTGMTNDLGRRLAEHQGGKGAKYTRGRTPVRLVYQEVCGTKGQALSREYRIKRMSRLHKKRLIAEGGPDAGTKKF